MTRRNGIVALLVGTVRFMAGDESALAQGNTTSVGRTADFSQPRDITIILDSYKAWHIHHGNDVVTLTPEEIFAALKQEPR